MNVRRHLLLVVFLVVACAEAGGGNATRDSAVPDARGDGALADAAGQDAALSDARADVATAFDASRDASAESSVTPSSGTLPIPANSSDFGNALALSEDGNTLVVGDWNGSANEQGAAFVYTRSGASWNAGQSLPVPSSVGAFGNSVATSDDGSVVVVSDWSGGADELGRVFVYLRSENYATATALTRPSNNDNYGWTIAVSGDGNTVAVGDYAGGADGNGQVSLYTRTNNTWSAPTMLPVFAESAAFGDDVAFSRDGNVLVVGDTNGGGDGNGAALVYTRSNGVWSQGAALTRPAGTQSFGYNVAINRDATTIAVGDPSGGGDTFGSVTLYKNNSGSWNPIAVPRPAVISPVSGDIVGAFGASLRLSNDGNTLLVGDYEVGRVGAAHVFSLDANLTWSTRTFGRPATARGFGRAVAISGDGRFAVVSDEEGGAAQDGEVSLFTL